MASTALKTCKTFPPPPTKLASILFKVPASLIKNSSVSAGAVANSVSAEIISCPNLAFDIIPSAKSNAMVKLLKRKHNDLRRKNRKCVHGVVHMIEKSDLESIFDKREQCHVRKQVAVKTYSGKSIPNVEVYYGNNGKQHKENFTLKPEVRYLKLIYCGAAERKLNTKYLDKLKEVLLKTSKTDRHDDNVLDCKSLSVLKTPNVDKTEATKTVKCLWG